MFAHSDKSSGDFAFELAVAMSNSTAQVGMDCLVSRKEPSWDRFSVLQEIFDADPDGVYVRDREGICRMVNISLSAALGLARNQMTGRPVARIFPPETACVLMEQEEMALVEGIPQERELMLEFATGECPCHVTHGILRNSEGHAVGVFGRFRDISERKRMEREIVQSCERELRRVARDLHDDLCQELAAVSLISKLLQKRLDETGSSHGQVAGHLADLTKRLAVAARNLVHNIAPEHFQGDEFLRRLQSVAADLCAAFPLKCGIEGAWPEELRDNEPAIQLFRIVHEAMHNAAKHSGGNYITVRLRASEDSYSVCVSDNGKGFTPEAHTASGMGLHAMRHRAAMIGALLSIESVPGKGTTVICKLTLRSRRSAS